jgi:4-amino-4-deoxychorismate lyase
MSAPLASWIDGLRTDVMPADDRALHYGDGLFETIVLRSGCARFLEAHLARLALGCARLGIRFTDMPRLRAEVAEAISLAPRHAILKIIVSRGSTVRRGYAPRGTETARRMLWLWPAAEPVPPLAAGVTLELATTRLGENPLIAGIKHLSRIENVLAAARAAEAGAFEALMLDTSERVISGAMSNVFAVRDGRVITPRVDRCGVAGVMRGIVLRECSALGLQAAEASISVEDLLNADEVFLTNVRIGVVPVGRVGEHACRMNTCSQRLTAHIENLDA